MFSRGMRLMIPHHRMASWEPRRLPITLLWLAVPAPHIDSIAPSVGQLTSVGLSHDLPSIKWTT